MTHSMLTSLLAKEAYPEPTTTVTLIQTHVSWIFLTDTFAYKIKKPVSFSFLDFSTPQQRQHYCEEEVRLNRRLCKDIYVGVVELKLDGQRPNFCEQGNTIDYAVKMKRLPQNKMLDKMLADGRLSLDIIKRIAIKIRRFHESADTSPAISHFGSLDTIKFNWMENFQQMAQFENNIISRHEHGLIQTWVNNFMESHADIFEQRLQLGHIRDCDGDIHLENICVDDDIYIFDCIEFNERFRYSDTIADLAFILMDLDVNSRRDLSDALLSAYYEGEIDTTLASIIRFYKIYRAFVRGKVLSFQCIDPDISEIAKAEARHKALMYFRLIRGYIELPKLPLTLFITTGLMGCGKSTLAKQLSFELGIAMYNSDIIRKELNEIPPGTRVWEEYGKGIYSKSQSEATYLQLAQLARLSLSSGRSTIIDASFRLNSDRKHFAEIARQFHAKFVILKIWCSESIQKDRLQIRQLQRTAISDGRLELINLQLNDYNHDNVPDCKIICLNSAMPADALTSEIYEALHE